MTDSSGLRRADRWLEPLAIVIALIGFFGPWIPHKAVALVVTGFELSEFAKFFPEVQAGAAGVQRFLFLAPLTASALILGLWANAHVGGRGVRIATTGVAALIALAAMPQYESLTAPDYRAQLLMAVGGCALTGLTLLSRGWPTRGRRALAALIALAGIWAPVAQTIRLHPLVVVLYNRPVGVGWGVVVCALGFGTVAAWTAFRALGADPRNTRAEAHDRDRTEEANMSDDKAIVFYGTSWCPDCLMARRVLDQKGATYHLVDIDKDPSAAAYVMQVNRGFRSVPTIVFPDGSILVEPPRSQLIEKLSAMA